MPEIGDVVAGQDVLAAWGNAVRDRATMRYSTLAALDASEPGAADGSLRWAADTGLVVRSGGVWEVVGSDLAFLPLAGGTLTGSLLLAVGQTATPLSIMEWFGGIAFRENVNNYITLGGTDSSASLYIAEAGGGVTVNVPLTVPDGSSGAPGLAFAGGSGFFLNAQGRVTVPSSMSLIDNRLYMTSPDGVSNGYYFFANVSDGADFGFAIRALNDTEIVQMRADGKYFIPGVYANTTGNAANVEVASDGLLRRSTSARRFKRAIKALRRGRKGKASQDHLLDAHLEPVEFTHIGDADDESDADGRYLGFIADDLAALDPRLGQYGPDGEVENYDLRGVVAVLAAQVNELRATVARLHEG